MTGHKAAVATLAFSNDGRFLISGGASGDARILLWDLAHGHLIGKKQALKNFILNTSCFWSCVTVLCNFV